MTRIIAGAAGGRRLAVPRDGTRPTTDRVRESLFSSLDSRLGSWSGLRVLDLYAGTGALGLEALSRGAAGVVLVEKDPGAVRLISANIAAVGLPGADAVRADVAAFCASPGEAFDLVLADPPYSLDAMTIREALAALESTGRLHDDCLVVVERPRRDPGRPFPEGWAEERLRTYGETALWYGQPSR